MKNKGLKRFFAAVAALSILITMSSCGTGENPPIAPEDGNTIFSTDTHSITDHSGNEVTVPKVINRIAVCDLYPLPSVLSVFFNSADKIVGMPQPSMTAAQNSLLGELYPEILNVSTGYIDGTNVNIEELLKLEPDVVFYSESSPEIGEKLSNAGFAAIALSVSQWGYNAIETLNQWITLLNKIFPDSQKASLVKQYSDSTYELVQKRVKSLTDEQRERAFFLFQYSDASITTSGKQFFGEWWAEAIGAVNVAGELQKDNSVTVNMEQIYKWNPSLIFITNFNAATADDIINSTVGSFDWSEISAVKSKKVFKMPLGMYRSYTPGVDTPITLLSLAKMAYPELFSDIDITEKTKEYYGEVFGISLTDAQVKKIFAPVTAAGTGFAN